MALSYQVIDAFCSKVKLSKNKSGSAFDYTVDGATVMSEEYYKDKDLSQIVILKVRKSGRT